MDMFGMMGEIMGNMVSSFKQFQISRKYLPSQVIPVSEQNVFDLYYFLLLGKNLRFTELSDVFLFNSDLLLLFRLRASRSLSTDQSNKNRPWRGEDNYHFLIYYSTYLLSSTTNNLLGIWPSCFVSRGMTVSFWPH